MCFYLNAYRVIISLYDTACCGRLIFPFCKHFLCCLADPHSSGCYWLQYVVHPRIILSTMRSQDKTNHTYPIQLITHRRQIMRRYVFSASLREKLKVNFSLCVKYVLNNHCHRVTTQLQLINIIIIIIITSRRQSKCTAPVILNHDTRWR